MLEGIGHPRTKETSFDGQRQDRLRSWKEHPGSRILIGLSGRGDKDMPILQRTLLKGKV
jgi:tryptophan synthase beta subunit